MTQSIIGHTTIYVAYLVDDAGDIWRMVGTSVHEAVTALAEHEGLVDRIQVVAAQIPLPAAMPVAIAPLADGPAPATPAQTVGLRLVRDEE